MHTAQRTNPKKEPEARRKRNPMHYSGNIIPVMRYEKRPKPCKICKKKYLAATKDERKDLKVNMRMDRKSVCEDHAV